MIQDFYITPFTVKRASWTEDGEGNKQSAEITITTFSGHIQQANAELVQSLGLTLTKSFSVWCPLNTDVLEGDTLEASSGLYSVKAKQRNAVGDNKHLELIVQLDTITT